MKSTGILFTIKEIILILVLNQYLSRWYFTTEHLATYSM